MEVRWRLHGSLWRTQLSMKPVGNFASLPPWIKGFTTKKKRYCNQLHTTDKIIYTQIEHLTAVAGINCATCTSALYIEQNVPWCVVAAHGMRVWPPMKRGRQQHLGTWYWRPHALTIDAILTFLVVHPQLPSPNPSFSKPRTRTANSDFWSRLTHEFLGRLKYTIPNLQMYIPKKVNSEKLGLGIDSPRRTFFFF